MYLKNISLLYFKNYAEASFEFKEHINLIAGNNGVGKTNLLDAIHYLCMTKSYFHASDLMNIKKGEDLMLIQGTFLKNNNDDKVYCGVKRGNRKSVKINENEYDKLSDHIGKFPVVMISPTDSELIIGGSEERRKWVDIIISQFDSHYLNTLISYNKILSQRNAYLKQCGLNGNFDNDTLEVYNDQLVLSGEYIHTSRNFFFKEFEIYFEKYYTLISSSKEKVELKYISQLHANPFNLALKAYQSKDRALEYTSVGIHKDDIDFVMNDFLVKKQASQGQQKSFLMALKLAQLDFIFKRTQIMPLLLLDDVYDKLDEERISNLLKIVTEHQQGQIFITDTQEKRVSEILSSFQIKFNLITI